MTFGDLANLVVALSDLKAVDAVVSAINANLPKTGPLGTIPVGANPATRDGFIHSGEANPRIEPRRVFHPEPRVLPRPIFHPTPRIEPRHDMCPTPADAVTSCEGERVRYPSPILPAWKTLPPVSCEREVIRPKVFIQKVDVINKGSLIDFFL